jgi:hypothetical protein
VSMECYCEPESYDDYCAVWNVTWRRARKEHKCCECHETIRPGERYEHVFYVFEGTPGTYKTCEFCATEFARLEKKHPDAQFVKGDLACIVVWDIRNEERAHG